MWEAIIGIGSLLTSIGVFGVFAILLERNSRDHLDRYIEQKYDEHLREMKELKNQLRKRQ